MEQDSDKGERGLKLGFRVMGTTCAGGDGVTTSAREGVAGDAEGQDAAWK